MTFKLRDYQTDLIDQARQAIADKRKTVLMVAPTGAGKTALAAYMLGTAAARGRRAWFIVHRRELITQSSRTFEKVGIAHGIIGAGFTPDRRAPVQIAGIQTLKNRLRDTPPPSLIIWDECHHVASKSWSDVFSAFPDVVHIGLTATPCRMDGRGLGEWFDTMVEGPTTAWLIENGFLSPFKFYAPSSPDMSGVRTVAGDFDSKAMSETMDKPALTGDVISHYQRLCHGKRAIVFATNIQHSQNVVGQFRAAGYRAEHLDGKTDRVRRDSVLKDFEAGRVSIISNVDLFGEGFDVPAIEAVILLRPTQSTGLYLQQVGRALRTSDGKSHAIILDHAGNGLRHGLPNMIRDWSLDAPARAKRSKPSDVLPIKQCMSCYAVHAPAPACPECGHVYVTEARTIEQVAGELVEVSADIVLKQKKREQASAKTIDDLIALGRSRGHKNPEGWAKHVHKARMMKHG
jgi:DNA repair protein RadD